MGSIVSSLLNAYRISVVFEEDTCTRTMATALPSFAGGSHFDKWNSPNLPIGLIEVILLFANSVIFVSHINNVTVAGTQLKIK